MGIFGLSLRDTSILLILVVVGLVGLVFSAELRRRSKHFCWEVYRLWPAILVVGATFWYFETLRARFPGEPDWLRTIAKANHVCLGVIIAHVTFSLAFPYIKMGSMLYDLRETMRNGPPKGVKEPPWRWLAEVISQAIVFSTVTLARALYYAIVAYATARGI